MISFEKFLDEWVETDPENDGCYTLKEVEYCYEQYLRDLENDHANTCSM